MEIKEYNDFSSIQVFKEQWDTLVKRTKPEEWLFYTYDWYKNWWEAFGSPITPVMLLVFENNDLIGIAPCGLSKVIKYGIPIQQIALLANEHSPKNSIIAKNNNPDITYNIIQYIIKSYPGVLVYFEDLAESDPIYNDIINYVNNEKLTAKERVARTTAIIDITGDWAGYLKNKTKKYRTYTRKIEKEYQADRFKLKSYRDLEEIPEFIRIGQLISAHSWQGSKNTSIFSKKHLKRFYNRVAELAAKEGMLDILCLFNKGMPIAYLFNICINNTVYLIKQEYDSRYSSLAPGFYLDLVIIKEAFARKMKCVDMLGFATPYKERWSTKLNKDARIFIYQSRSTKLVGFIDFTMREFMKNILRKQPNG